MVVPAACGEATWGGVGFTAGLQRGDGVGVAGRGSDMAPLREGVETGG